jgi:hypothetical protein
VAFEETLDGTEAKHQALIAQDRAHFIDRSVAIGAEGGEDGGMVCIGVMTALVAAYGFGSRFAMLALKRPPTADARSAHRKPLGCGTVRKTIGYSSQNATSQVERK